MKVCSLHAALVLVAIPVLMFRRLSPTTANRVITLQPDQYPTLRAFLDHSNPSYHTSIDADSIRSNLLSWYQKNRRRLPWRGDAPPYNGSTAASAMNAASKNSAPESVGETPQPVSAYGVWVSEIMLQQTRVEAVIPYWIEWMKAFPTVEALANATEEEVNAKWAGLGFYRRAKYLHEGSKQVVRDFGGQLPTTVDALLQIKGIGPYTAGAIASISAGVSAPIVDGNVLRVLARLCAIVAHPKEPAFANDGKIAWQIAKVLVEAGGGHQPGNFNQALMEIGATYCAPAGSGIDERDPLVPQYRTTRIGREAYKAHKAGELASMLNGCAGLRSCPLCANGADIALDRLHDIVRGSVLDEDSAASLLHTLLPLSVPKKARREERLANMAIYKIQNDENNCSTISWLLVKRPEEGLLANQWEFPNDVLAADKGVLLDYPGVAAHEKANNRILSSAKISKDDLKDFVFLDEPLEHVFSHVRHTMHVVHARCVSREDSSSTIEWTSCGRSYSWMNVQDMKEVGVTAGVQKVIAAVEQARAQGQESASKKSNKKRPIDNIDDARQTKVTKFFAGGK